jgi:hypothetical protein
MSLHDDIVNLPDASAALFGSVEEAFAYKVGHRDARHAAAELALAADARIAELEARLRTVAKYVEVWERAFLPGTDIHNAYADIAQRIRGDDDATD